MQHNVLKELSHVFAEIPFNRMLGLQLTSIEADYIMMNFTMKKELIGNFMKGILHGGVISSVLDMAGGVAAMVTAIQKYPTKNLDELKLLLGKSSTINLTVNFLRPGKGEQFFAKAWVSHSGNKVCFTQIELYNDKNTLIASGSGTYLVG